MHFGGDMKGLVSIFGLFVALLPFGTSVPALAQTTTNDTQVSMQVPEHVIYEFYFRRIAFYENLAQKKEKDGLSGDMLRAAITNELGISEVQRIVLAQIGAQSLAEAAALDAQAAAIIQREHSRYPGGKLSSKDQVPQIPPELTKLQASRNSVFLNAKAQLSKQLDESAFQNIDSRIKAVILPKVSVKSPR
jgi:hypothetical protein